MEWRNKLIWIIISVVFLGMVYLSYSYGTTKPSQKVLNAFVKKYEDIISEKDKTIADKEELLKVSEKKYNSLVSRIKAKAAEAKNIKQPTNVEETKRRFNEAGYPTH